MNPTNRMIAVTLMACVAGCESAVKESAGGPTASVDANLGLSSLTAAQPGKGERCHELLPEDIHVEVDATDGSTRAMGRHMYLRGSTTGEGSLALSGLLKEDSTIPGSTSTALHCLGNIGADNNLSIGCHVVTSRIDAQGEPVETKEELDCSATYVPPSPADEAPAPTGSELTGSYSDYGDGSTEQAVDNTGGEEHECRLSVGRLKVSIDAGQLVGVDRAAMKGELPDDAGRTTVEGTQCFVGLGKRYDEKYRCDLHFFQLGGVPHVDEHCVVRVDIYDGETDAFEQTREHDCYGLAKKME